jgi:3-oxoacyl-[acyl-carrier protein] reductase
MSAYISDRFARSAPSFCFFYTSEISKNELRNGANLAAPLQPHVQTKSHRGGRQDNFYKEFTFCIASELGRRRVGSGDFVDLDLWGKTALVLGGSRGIGQGIASALACEGVRVGLLARASPRLEEAVGKITALGHHAVAVAADLANPNGVTEAFAKATRALGRLDIIVLNTGAPDSTKASGLSIEAWKKQYHLLVEPLIELTDLVLPQMIARQWGRVLYVASPGILSPSPHVAVAQSMRMATANWLKSLAAEVGLAGITVNTLIPGVIEGDGHHERSYSRAKAVGVEYDQYVNDLLKRIPVGRAGTPAEFGAIATFLASPLAAYVTGSVLRIDGGSITRR